MITTQPNVFCCGITELGNFGYTKVRGPQGLAHYHRINGSWSAIHDAEPETTEDEIRRVLDQVTTGVGAVLCSTGADQEYLDPILTKLGFTCNPFTNRTHEKGLVKLWFLASENYVRLPAAKPAK